jgi:membrane-bound serine protease (ClpP class)
MVFGFVSLFSSFMFNSLTVAFLAYSFFRASLQIQVAVVICGIAILSIRTFRLYRGVRARMLAKVRTGPEVLVGAIGIVITDLRPKGEVRVNGEFWQAVAKEGWIEKDREVEVVGMDGLVLSVNRVKEKA